jgi:hypothetical protein
MSCMTHLDTGLWRASHLESSPERERAIVERSLQQRTVLTALPGEIFMHL